MSSKQGIDAHLCPPSSKETPGYETLRHSDRLVFGENAERCKFTGRIFEQGHGALSREEQTQIFLREAGLEALAALPVKGKA
jgi:hypothetical protein